MADKILIADDDINICELLRLYLTKENFEVLVAHDGRQAVEMYDNARPALVVLDVMMPVMDGWEACRQIRARGNTPIIMLTAKGDTADKVEGLGLGADDYMVKPFDTKEFLARVKAALRRAGAVAPAVQGNTARVCTYDNLVVDLDKYALEVRGKRVDAPPKELALLSFLATNPGRVFTRDQLLNEVWGFAYYGDSRTVDVHIKRLREKLENVSNQWELKTVWGVGYQFAVNK